MTPLSFEYPVSVAILFFTGRSSDLKDTLETVHELTRALEGRGHAVRTMRVNRENWRRAMKVPGEVVFNLVEDPTWELYVKVARRLIDLGRAQVGLDGKTLDWVVDKALVKRKLAEGRVSTPLFRILTAGASSPNIRKLEYPLIVKPGGQHAAIGISQDSVVIDERELNERVHFLWDKFGEEAIVEQFIDGREVHVYVLGNGRRSFALPGYEVQFGGEFENNWGVFTYQAKWSKSSWEYWNCRELFPTTFKQKEMEKIESLAVKAVRLMGCSDLSRVDLRVDDKTGRAYVVDVNACPSLNRYPVTDKILEALDWTYEDFLETVLAITYKRAYGKMPDRMRERSFLLARPEE